MPTPRPLANATTKTTRAGTPKRPATKTRRRPQPRSRGLIAEKEPGRWLVRVTIGRDPLSGKRRTVAQTVTGTRTDAHRALTALLAKADAGAFDTASAPAKPATLTLAAFLRDTWLAERRGDVKTGKLSARAFSDYARQVEKLAEHFGAVALDAIDKRTVAEVRRLLVERFKPNAAQRAFDVFRMALRYAWRLDMIAQNPALAVARVTTPAPRTGVLTPEQVGAFLTAAEGYHYGRYAALFHVSLLAGLRPGEVAALTWADLQGATLRVQRAVTVDMDGKRVVGPTKNRRERVVALPAEAVAALERHRKWQTADVMRRGARAAWAEAGAPMFLGDDGKPVTVGRIQNAWATIRRRAKLPPVRLYDARHTFCTTLLHAGVDARTVADLAGHVDPAMTLRRYAHATTASKQDAAAKLSAALAGVLPLRRSA